MAHFKPSLGATLLLLGLAAVFAALGAWQWQRAADKAARLADFGAADTVTGLPDAAQASEFTRVRLAGRFDTRRHVLADNRVLNGRAGVHVYTPFTESGGATLLVNRGWLPLPASRLPLPAVPTADDELAISGRLGPIQGPGRQLGPAAELDRQHWPQLVTYPSVERVAAAMGSELYPWVLYLDPDSPGGFGGRDWPPVYMTPQKHRAYAVQWYALALLALVCWGIVGWRRGTGE